MRTSLLLIVAIFATMLVGCGSVNSKNSSQRNAARLNPHDPMMTSRYMQRRSGTGH